MAVIVDCGRYVGVVHNKEDMAKTLHEIIYSSTSLPDPPPKYIVHCILGSRARPLQQGQWTHKSKFNYAEHSTYVLIIKKKCFVIIREYPNQVDFKSFRDDG